MSIIKFLNYLHKKYIASQSTNEDQAHREYIFTVLVLGFLVLVGATMAIVTIRSIFGGERPEEGISIGDLMLPFASLLALYYCGRRAYSTIFAYILLLLYIALGTVGLLLYGAGLAQGLLIYALAIVIAGILISARASLILAALLIAMLTILGYLQINGITHPYTAESYRHFQVADSIILCVIFGVLALVSWLSNREIEASLQRARKSEKDLRAERNKLEITVARRTKELETAQLEKARDMYRFAEFGRLGASLLHDLSNPLTAVSLSFERLESTKKGIAQRHVREGITSMEQYVRSARRQLRNQGENKQFDTRSEIEKIIDFQSSRARDAKVKVYRRLTKHGRLYGDDIKFHQVISNLLGNAIDSFARMPLDSKRTIWIKSSVTLSPGVLKITVQDNGVGINPKEIDKIFKPFFSTKSSDRGLGIGLTITQQIIEHDFKGTLRVNSTKNSGTTFAFEIPIHNQ